MIFANPAIQFPKTWEEFWAFAIERLKSGTVKDYMVNLLPEIIAECKKRD